ncbi:MAG TPA: phosphoribulokinase [Candidatus Omnitrophota bacterium]|nr:phosphoribulokinase [Candidatus Omnitrophota bacterium]
MSKQHPIIAVTGASGAGRGVVRSVFQRVCDREAIRPAFVEGESFHRFTRAEMRDRTAEARAGGDTSFSHFGPAANVFAEQEKLYRAYGETGVARIRHYAHTADDARALGWPDVGAGEFTPWHDLPDPSDCLIYEGLHGVVKADGVDLSKLVDLKIGVTPIMNLEWIQKMHRDTKVRGYSEEAVVEQILNRMPDYVRYVIPQFKISDINFQHVAVVDTSDPMVARDVPTLDERVVVIRFRKPEEFGVDFPWLLSNLPKSWMSRRNTLVVPGSSYELAMEMIITPILRRLMEWRKRGA